MGFSSGIGNRMGMSSFVIKDIGYVFGGYNLASQDFKKDLWAYDPASNTWTQKAGLPGINNGRVECAAFAINGKGYIVSGALLSYGYKEVWEFDPDAGRGAGAWTQKADFPAIGRSGSVGFAINGKGYVAIGYGWVPNAGSGYLVKDLWEYDPTKDVWTEKVDLPAEERANSFVFVSNNKAYLGCGKGAGKKQFKELWVYDPVTNVWQQKADYPGLAVRGLFSYSNGISGFVGTGGMTDDVGNYIYTKDFWKYFPTSNTWTQLKEFKGYQRDFAVGFYLKGAGYAGLGRHAVYLSTNDLYKYTP